MKSLIIISKFFINRAKLQLLFLVAITGVALLLESFSIVLIIPIFEGIESKSSVIKYYKLAFDWVNINFTLENCLLVAVILIWLRCVFLIIKDYLINNTIKNMLIDWRQDLVNRSFEIKYQWFIGKSSGYFNNLLVYEFEGVVNSFRIFCVFIVSVMMALVYLCIPLALAPSLVSKLLLFLLPLFFVVRLLMRKTKVVSLSCTRANELLQKMLIQTINNYKYLKSTYSYATILKQVLSHGISASRERFKLQVLQSFSANINMPFAATIISFIVYQNVIIGKASIASQAVLLGMLYKSFTIMSGLQVLLQKIVGRWGGIQLIETFEKDLNDNQEEFSSNEVEHKEWKSLTADSVYFDFDNGNKVLQDISFDISKNTSIALVGESGAGKSTLANLLIGLFPPTSGKFKLGDMDYKSLNINKFRSSIGYITQESVIFNDTVLNNITLWDEPYNEEKIKRAEDAAKKAHIDDFIVEQKGGYDSLLGESGINISGGQRQRISIARELYKEPDILVFDEATSSLDTSTEIEIQKSIEEFIGKKTVIIIAHRLSTVKHVDKIFVMQDGKIVESGSYEELIDNSTVFKKMIEQQAFGHNKKE
jgi:subfamily B ATP-binding cassette protein MsbA